MVSETSLQTNSNILSIYYSQITKQSGFQCQCPKPSSFWHLGSEGTGTLTRDIPLTHFYIDIYIYIYMGGCQNYGPFLGTLNIRCCIIYNRDKKRDHNFDNHSYLYNMSPGIPICASCNLRRLGSRPHALWIQTALPACVSVFWA